MKKINIKQIQNLRENLELLIENYIDLHEYNSYSNDHVYCVVGDIKITKETIKKYTNNISSYYGDFTDQTIQDSLENLYKIDEYYRNGGILYRLVWLTDLSEFDTNNLGYHWCDSLRNIENVEFSLGMLDSNKNKECFIIKAKTDKHNVSIPSDYFNNLNESEITIIDQNCLEFISIEPFNI